MPVALRKVVVVIILARQGRKNTITVDERIRKW
jgi:hypothetical protein